MFYLCSDFGARARCKGLGLPPVPRERSGAAETGAKVTDRPGEDREPWFVAALRKGLRASAALALCIAAYAFPLAVLHPDWEARALPLLIAAMAGPLALLAWAWLTGADERGARVLRVIRRALLAHALLGLAAFVIGFAVLAEETADALAFPIATLGFWSLVMSGLALALSPGAGARPEGLRAFHAGLRVASLSFAAGLLAWALGTAMLVAMKARALAGQEPFCLQAADGLGGGYTPVRTRLALNGFVLLAGKNDLSRSLSFHGVLVVGAGERRRLYNWSYRTLSFTPLETHALRAVAVEPACEPRVDFIGALPWFRAP